MRRLRPVALAALLASASLVPSPASAQPVFLVFSGTVDVDCFGCDVPSPCHADLIVYGVTHSGNAATTACTATEPSGALCLLTGTARGTVVGTSGTMAGLTLDFVWTRVGNEAVITISGDSSGWGRATLVLPPGTACGAPLNDATVAGWVAGV